MRKIIAIFMFLSLTIGFNSAIAQEELNFEEVGRLGGRGYIQEIAWSPDEQMLAVGGSNGLWLYTSTFEDVMHLESTIIPFGTIAPIAWSPDGTMIAGGHKIEFQCCGSNSLPMIHVWDTRTGELIQRLSVPDNHGFFTLFWSTSGEFLYGVLDVNGGSLLIKWHMNTGQEVYNVQLGVSVSSASPVEDTNVLLVEMYSSRNPDIPSVRIDLATGEIIDTLSREELFLNVSPDGRYNAEFVRNVGIVVTDITEGGTNFILIPTEVEDGPNWGSPQWTPDGRLVTIVLGVPSQLVVWNVETRERILEVPVRFTDTFAVDAYGERVSVAERGGEIKIIDLRTGTLLASQRHYYYVAITDWDTGAPFAWSPDGQRIATADAISSGIHIWDVASQSIESLYSAELTESRMTFFFLSWSPDGSLIAASGIEIGETPALRVYVWNAETGEIIRRLTIEGLLPPSLQWDTSGMQLTTVATVYPGIVDGNLIVWDVSSGEIIQQLNDPTVVLAEWDSQGSLLAEATSDRGELDPVVNIWDASLQNVVATLEMISTPEDLSWRPGTSLLLITQIRGYIAQLWNTDSGLFSDMSPIEGYEAMAWSPDGRWLAGVRESRLDSIPGEKFRVLDVLWVDMEGNEWRVMDSMMIDRVENFSADNNFSWSSDSRCIAVKNMMTLYGVSIWCNV